MGLLVVIEGIDGSGKGTQAQRLHESLQADGIRAALLSFPRYEATRFGERIGDFLNGRFGALDEVSPFLAALLYAGDRFESRTLIEQSIAENDVLICDRYVPSNIAHQGAKLEDGERDEIIEWIEATEYEINGLPKPDVVLFLDVPVVTAQQLIARKAARSYTDKAADLQEADGGYLAKVSSVYRQLAANEDDWRRVNCLEDDTVRSIEAIGQEVRSLVDAVRAMRSK